MAVIYIIGSLRNPRIPEVANLIRAEGHEAVDDWFSPGPDADSRWQEYEQKRGRSYKEAINGLHASHVFAFDKYHLDRADAALLVQPAGRSAHMELGYMARTKPAFVLFEGMPERFDVMYRFATDLFFSDEEFVNALQNGAIV